MFFQSLSLREVSLQLSIAVNLDTELLEGWVGSSASMRGLAPVISFFANLFANVDGAEIVLPAFAMRNEF